MDIGKGGRAERRLWTSSGRGSSPSLSAVLAALLCWLNVLQTTGVHMPTNGTPPSLNSALIPRQTTDPFGDISNGTQPGCQTPDCVQLVRLCGGVFIIGDTREIFNCICGSSALPYSDSCLQTCPDNTGATLSPGQLANTCSVVAPNPTPVATMAPDTSTSGSGSKLSTGAIIGIAVGGGVALFAVALLAFFLIRRHRKHAAPTAQPAMVVASQQPFAPLSPLSPVSGKDLPTLPPPLTSPYPPSAPPYDLARADSVSSAIPTLRSEGLTNFRELAGVECAALRTYLPEREDELLLNAGDGVTITEAYEDGWAKGVNKITRQEGMFPLACGGFENRVD